MVKEAKFYGWPMVAVLFTLYLLIGGMGIYGPTTVNTLMLTETGMSRNLFGLSFLVFNLCQGVVAPIVAWIINTRGIKTSLIIGAGLLALSGLLLGTVVDVVKFPWLFVMVFGVLAGASIGFGGPVPNQAGVNLWFNKNRALAMAIVMSATGVGGFIIAPLMVKIAATSGTYKAVWLFVCLLSLVAMVIAAVFVKNKPEDLGQVPDGKIIEDTGPKKVSRVYKATVAMEPKKALRHPKMWLITIALVGVFFPYMFCLGHSMAHILDRGFTTATAAMAIGLMPFCSIFGRLAVGAVGDFIEPRWLWLCASIMMVIGYISLMNAQTYTHLVVYAIFIGFGWGASFVCMPTLFGNYFGGATYASIMAVVFPIMQLAGAISPGMAGSIFDATGSYQLSFIIGLAFFATAFVALLLASPPKATVE
jgi:MFS family permease